MRRTAIPGLIVGALIGLIAARMTDEGSSLPKPSAPASQTAETIPNRSPFQSVVAQARGGRVGVYANPGDAAPAQSLDDPQPSGAPLVFLVEERRPSWLRVQLPVRPNGSTGWVRAEEVVLSSHEYRIVIRLGLHRITVYDGPDILLEEPVGVGTSDTPTPGGVYYTKELLQPPNPGGPYGSFAYGLSGFSNVLTDFAGGDGVIGIHGTNDPSSLGKDVSHGCIRMSNAGIERLARILPLGVPVAIEA